VKKIKEFDYDWINNNTSHHEYLISSVKNLLHEINLGNEKLELLDVGCGNGYLTKTICNEFRKTLGIDLSKEGINQAEKYTNENLNFLNSDMENLISEGKKFDFISSFEVIEHQYLPDLFLKNISKLLKTNGYFLVSTPYHGYIKNLLISLLNKHDSHYNPHWRHGHIKFFSIKTFTKTLGDSGFKIVKHKFSGRFYPISSSMIFLCKKI
tara:strand:- start:59 stop:688 length:630 start_codon:yes stop_codon:yes gene_type:complete